jgi:HlyD family type I secretion membrane fusion protein
LVLRNSEQVLELLIGQETIFASRRRRIEGEVEILHRRVGSLTAEIRSYRAQERAAINQLSLLHEEIVPLERLVAKQISPKPKLLQLKRQAAHFGGVRDQQRGLIARAEQLVEETKLKMIDVRNKRLDEIVSALSDAQTQLGQYRERLVAAHDVLERRDIVSPIDGTVVNVQYFTPGGVVAPGSAIMDIVPRNDDLIIETRIKPIDVDAIEVGLLAEVRFTAFKQRTTPTLSGEVVYVSADILTDPEIEEAYFIARTKISAEELVRLDGLEIMPGMPAQVMIIGDERTLLEYLGDPIRQSLRRAFREQ